MGGKMSDEFKEEIKMVIDMSEAMCDIVGQGKFLNKLAKLSMQYYSELKKVGFSHDSAMMIVANFNFGSKK